MMKRDTHIINLLENSPLHALSEVELNSILEHISTCQSCGDAYQAAQISATLIEARVKEKIEPSPFFQTRILAQVRELRANEGWGLMKLWRAAGALCSSMAAAVVILGFLTFSLPAEPSLTSQETTRVSAEAVILNQTEFIEELGSDGQVLRTLYAGEEDAVR